MSIQTKPRKDLTGERFGRLTVLRRGEDYMPPSRGAVPKYVCRCDCGHEVSVVVYSLTGGLTKSCGCLRRDMGHFKNLSHGLGGSRLYRVWVNMLNRCFSAKNDKYEFYGGRGISVCSDWLKSTPFLEWALSNGYREGLQIDRIDNDGDYEPSNCRWVTPHVNSCNKRKQCNNTSGYVGVVKNHGRWGSRITVNGVRHHIGNFKTAEDAARARNKYIVKNGLEEYKIQDVPAERREDD